MAEMSALIAIAISIFIVLIVLAYLIGKLFKNRGTRTRVTIGTIVAYYLVCAACFGFIAFVLRTSQLEAGTLRRW